VDSRIRAIIAASPSGLVLGVLLVERCRGYLRRPAKSVNLLDALNRSGLCF
jgi:hypothetical protein